MEDSALYEGGGMKGDFSRLTFRSGKRYTSVRLQQGRVTLDSDWNEQTAIREYPARVRFEDVVGTSAVPGSTGFAAPTTEMGRWRSQLVESTSGASPANWTSVRRSNASYGTRWCRPPADPIFSALDAWERHLTAVDDPELLDVALGGADTTTRLEVRDGATVPVSAEWVELEAGVEVRFSGGEFRSGDYWTVPARPATQSIEWPGDAAPDGIEHRLCPLALVTWAQVENGCTPMIQDCRRASLSLTDVHEEIAQLRLEIAELRNELARRG